MSVKWIEGHYQTDEEAAVEGLEAEVERLRAQELRINALADRIAVVEQRLERQDLNARVGKRYPDPGRPGLHPRYRSVSIEGDPWCDDCLGYSHRPDCPAAAKEKP